MRSGSELFQIGDVADQVGLSIRTLRHWEEVGLVRPTARSKGGFRLYSSADLARLEVVKAMKPIGLTLEEMGELLDLVDVARRPVELEGSTREEVTEALERYAMRTEERIKRILRDMDDATTLLETINTGIRRCRASARSDNDEQRAR